jgi:hypothetical protein
MSEPVVLTQRGVLHHWPAWEACNIDDSKFHVVFTGGRAPARDDPRYRRDCRRCFKENA